MSSDIGNLGKFYIDSRTGKGCLDSCSGDLHQNVCTECDEENYSDEYSYEAEEDCEWPADYPDEEAFPIVEDAIEDCRYKKGCIVFCKGKSRIICKKNGCIIFCESCCRRDVRDIRHEMECGGQHEQGNLSCIVYCGECKIICKCGGCIVFCKCVRQKPPCGESECDEFSPADDKDKTGCMIRCFQNCTVYC